MSIARGFGVGIAITVLSLVAGCGAAPDGESRSSDDQALANGPIGLPPAPKPTTEAPPPPPPPPPSPESRMTSTYCPTVHPACKVGVTGAPSEYGPDSSLIQMGYDCSLAESYDSGDTGGLIMHQPVAGTGTRSAALTLSSTPVGTSLYFALCKETPALDALLADGSLASNANAAMAREPYACDACLPVAKPGYVYVMYGSNLVSIAANGTTTSYWPFCGTMCLLTFFPPPPPGH